MLRELIEKQSKPFVISGPCSAETEEQTLETCLRLHQLGIPHMLRAGIWKPRTRPDSFEGVGEIGLQWLVEAGRQTGLPVTTEVANAQHVELALKAGIHVLWIGARTTVNPFSVQEIVDALRGTDVPVMIKNPVNPDLELWIGAFERFQKAGLTDLLAIHRGFSTYKHPKYRNIPNWEIPIAFRERLPEIPLICDPSHITGKRSLLQETAQKAMDLNYCGLMIESHCHPDEAWSDAAQQVTPEKLRAILDGLVLRSPNVSPSAQEKLEEFREKIAVLDDRLFDILSARMLLSEEVGAFKKENHITILQEEHWKRMIAKYLGRSAELKLSESFVRRIMDAIHQESIRHQTRVMNNPGES